MFFYADNELIQNNNNEELQNNINIITQNFEKIGLKTNKNKTKDMIIEPMKIYQPLSMRAYNKMCTIKGMTYEEL